MPDPQTPNLGLYIPLNASNTGAWDVPMNANFNLLDSVLGGNVSVTLSSSPVTLSSSQYNPKLVTFGGTLTADVDVTFPAIGRMYMLHNACTANTTYKVTTWISSAAGYVALPPNEPILVMADGTNMRFIGLGRVGTYADFGGTAIPAWITGSNPSPYLNCDGTSFSSATYPALAAYLGGTTLPDARGRFRAALNQGTGRLTAVNANTLLAAGGLETIARANLPSFALPVTDPTHTHTVSDPSHTHSVADPSHAHSVYDPSHAHGISGAYDDGNGIGSGGFTAGAYPVGTTTGAAGTGISIYGAYTGIGIYGNYTGVGLAANGTGLSVNSGGSGSAYAPPACVGGLTLIRAG